MQMTAEHPRRGTIIAALAEAERVFGCLSLSDPRRGELARRIRSLEEALDDVGEAA